jgi:hypothetical protein
VVDRAASLREAAYDPGVRAVALVTLAVLAGAGLEAPVRVTLDGVAGVRPGMPVSAVSAHWGVRLRPDYSAAPTCGVADLRLPGIRGFAVFMPRGRFGGVFLDRGAVTGRGIRIGSTLAEVRRAYRSLTSRPNRYFPGARFYFARRTAAPHWQLRFDVDANRKVTRIVFGTRDAVLLDEACA